MWVLNILEDGPLTGIQISGRIEQMTQGWWRPSPGSLYPLLDKMVEEGLLSRDNDKRYSLTESGRSDDMWPPWMGHHYRRRAGEDPLTEMDGYISYLEDLSKSDRNKLDSYSAQLVRFRDRLSALVQQGGEKE